MAPVLPLRGELGRLRDRTQIVVGGTGLADSYLRAKPGADDALGYLLRSVVMRCRSVRRAATRTEHSAFASALWTRPAWQREVLARRYFAELSGTQVAAAPGVNWDAVRRRIAWAGLRRWARNPGDRRQAAD